MLKDLIENNRVEVYEVPIPIFTRDFPANDAERSQVVQNDRLLGIIDKYNEKAIHPIRTELFDVVLRGYLTKDEIRFNEEREDGRNAQKWARIIGFTAIGASVLSRILAWWLSSGERDVTIKNPKAFQDTLKVLIVEHDVAMPDSFHAAAKSDSLPSQVKQ